MRVAILETVKASAGFELEFDRIIIEGLRSAGHEPVMMMPEGTVLDREFDVPTYYLGGGEIVSYDGVKGLKKLWYSLKREIRRVRWFDAAAETAREQGIEAILITTATYRYLRALRRSALRYSDIPVYFIFLGVNPSEKPKFLAHAHKCLPYKNIHLCITTLRDDFGAARPRNVRLIEPPVMIPDTIALQGEHDPLTIGFFGHYRRGEKNIELLLRTIEETSFTRPVRFRVQLAPTTAEDRVDVEGLATKYQSDSRLEFITTKLLGDDWYNAIAAVDALFIPYTAERYLYNWSAIYFNAIGARKVVLGTRFLNPEVMARFPIGEILDVDDAVAFRDGLKNFVDNYDANKARYQVALAEANKAFDKVNFIESILSYEQTN